MSDIGVASVVLAAFVLVVAALLTWRESAERRSRTDDLSPDDGDHFARQDRRRDFGICVLGTLAAGLVIGSRLEPRAGPGVVGVVGVGINPEFVTIWLGVVILLFLLIALAFRDWVALRRYAFRHRKEILRERIEILQDEIRRRKADEARDDETPGDPSR